MKLKDFDFRIFDNNDIIKNILKEIILIKCLK
ncbi:hypothetical protein [Campylobacter phage CJLB-7]|nr:hypothetical protein [Campylobacter phage CJLB-7]